MLSANIKIMIPLSLVKMVAGIKYRQILGVEKKLGYKIKLNPKGERWIEGNIIFDMTSVWKKSQIEATGVNYFTIGKVSRGKSLRFDWKSNLYQAWLGGYTVKFSKGREWSIEDHFRLGEADQKNWLQMYGVKDPVVRINFTKSVNLGEIKIGKYQGQLYQGEIASNSDVGNKTNSGYLKTMMAGGAELFKKSHPGLQIRASDMIPNWGIDSHLDPYQVINLAGLVVILEIDKETKAILYANGCSFTDRMGQTHDTFTKMKDELLKDLKRIEIVKV